MKVFLEKFTKWLDKLLELLGILKLLQLLHMYSQGILMMNNLIQRSNLRLKSQRKKDKKKKDLNFERGQLEIILNDIQ